MLDGIRHFVWTKLKKYDPTNWEKFAEAGLLQQTYDDQGWSGHSGQYRQRTVDRLRARISEIYDETRTPVEMLDVACFSGDYFGRLMLCEGMSDLLRYVGLDVTPKYVHNAAERWKAFDNAEFRQGSALDLPFEADRFDIIFNSGMLIHVETPDVCIREFSRVARRFFLVETTTNVDQRLDFVEMNKSGRHFIDRVYRPDYIRRCIGPVGNLLKETSVRYQVNQSTLFEAVPK